MKISHLLLGLIAASLSFSALSADKVYKWKDASGTLHFTDSPPPKGTEFDSVAVKTTAADASAPADAAKDAKDQAAPANTATADASKTGSDKQRCEDAKARVAQLQGTGDLAIEKDGKPVRMDKDARAMELNVARVQVQSYCGGTPQK